MSETQQDDKRRFARAPFDGTAILDAGKERFQVELADLSLRGARVLLPGDVGVGKTALIHRLTDNLDSSTIVAHITDPGLGTNDFFKLLAPLNLASLIFAKPTRFYSSLATVNLSC